MTDQTPDLAAAVADLGNALSRTLTGMTLRLTARAALGACLDHDDDHAAALLGTLDDEQLQRIEHAAVALSLHASRLRPDETETGKPGKVADEEPVAHLRQQIIDAINKTADEWVPEMPSEPAADRIMPLIAAALSSYRDEAREQRHRADGILRRAEAAEAAIAHEVRRADEQQARAYRAEADAADWRTAAQQHEATVERVRAWIDTDPVTGRNEFGNGYREALRDVRAILNPNSADSATMTTMGNTYNGTATLISGLDEIPVTAELHIESEPAYEEVDEGGFVVGKGVRRSWHGTLTSDDDRLIATITRACDLRLPDGATSRVHVPGGSHRTDDPAAEPVLVEVVGEGPAPWLDTAPVDNS